MYVRINGKLINIKTDNNFAFLGGNFFCLQLWSSSKWQETQQEYQNQSQSTQPPFRKQEKRKAISLIGAIRIPVRV